MPLLIGVTGVLAALAVPFGPVWTQQTTVQWPAPGKPTLSSTAFFAPYRPTELGATIPCAVLRAAATRGTATTVLSTAADGSGLLVRVVGGSAQVLLNTHLVDSAPVPNPPGPNGQFTGVPGMGMSLCGIRVDAASSATTIAVAGRAVHRVAAPAPIVQRLHTDLNPDQASGLSVTAHTSAVFDERATTMKKALIGLWAAAAALALGWLWSRGRALLHAPAHNQPSQSSPDEAKAPRLGAARTGGSRALVVVMDLAVGVVLAGWAVIGPLSDDDGFAAMIARNSRIAGFQGNYYRWWNASETPFALAQHLLAPLTAISLSPLWLRLPSTLLAMLTWLLLSRAVLPTALQHTQELPHDGLHDLPRMHVWSWRVRLLTAVCFLTCWLPFNLGVRPEAYVAAGLTAVLALLWRARTLWALGAATLIAGLSATASPAAVVLAAPMLIFAPRIWQIVSADTVRRREIAARIALLGCLGSVAPAVVFADQSWHAVAVATVWHTHFGPSLPWYDEFARYRYLLDADQDGTATKRVPVLLILALLPIVTLLLAHRTKPARRRITTTDPDIDLDDWPTGLETGVARLAAVAALGLGLLWLTPSKWTHYFGALAGIFAAFLLVAVLFLLRCARSPNPAREQLLRPGAVSSPGLIPLRSDPWPMWVGVIGGAAVAMAAGLAFSGPNAWWQPVVYDVPWAGGPITPAGLPLNFPPFWVGAAALRYLWVRRRCGRQCARRVVLAGPALLAVAAMSVSVGLLLVSFTSAPLRQPAGSLALATVHQLAGTPSCGLGDDIQVLPDVEDSVMAPTAEDPGSAHGFTYRGGFDPTAPPPDPPGVGASTQLWGSLPAGPDGALNTAALTTPWFRLPVIALGQQVSVSIAGRTDDGNALSLQFGHANPNGPVTPVGSRIPPDPLRHLTHQAPTYRLWRTVSVPLDLIPPGADRVRIHATDASSGPDGWLAVTGPRLRQAIGLREYLTAHSPVLVAWPMAMLFPCVTDPVAVHGGLAQAPVTVLEAPQQYSDLSAATTDSTIGGTFTPLRERGALGEVTTRLRGRPDADWGDLLLSTDPDTRDTYHTTITWQRVSGLHGIGTTPTPTTRPSTP